MDNIKESPTGDVEYDDEALKTAEKRIHAEPTEELSDVANRRAEKIHISRLEGEDKN